VRRLRVLGDLPDADRPEGRIGATRSRNTDLRSRGAHGILAPMLAVLIRRIIHGKPTSIGAGGGGEILELEQGGDFELEQGGDLDLE
jgi:hypothetical protein